MDLPLHATDAELPEIPRIDVGAGGPVALVHADPARFQAIMAAGLTHYGAAVLGRGDALSRRWLRRNANPHGDEIAAIAAAAGRPGAYLLNLSYEWTCTTSAAADPCGEGNRLLRTLDWPLDGLGRNVVVARMEGAAGVYENVTWPGFTGVATAMAPGRFSAALNQPPMRRWSFSCWLDWGINRIALWRRRALPPVHLLRQAFETCRTYAEAKRLLMETPLAMPAFFTLSGTEPGEGCVIEREEERAFLREAPVSVANHWIAGRQAGRARGVDSPGRFALMEALRDEAADDFTWVQPPILNPTTRLAVIANAAKGALSVQGWEEDGPATAVFRL